MKPDDTAAEHDTLSLRLPAQLLQRLAELARDNERSVSAEARLALRQHLERAAA